jgi:hypothetical protein
MSVTLQQQFNEQRFANGYELGERITASPAISGNDLIYRTDSHLYLIRNDQP